MERPPTQCFSTSSPPPCPLPDPLSELSVVMLHVTRKLVLYKDILVTSALITSWGYVMQAPAARHPPPSTATQEL